MPISISGICLLSLVSLAALVLIRQWKAEWAPFLRIAATVVFFGLILSVAAEVLDSVHALAEGAVPDELWTLLLKALGIAFLTELTSGICRDSGEATLATWVETVGKLELLLLSLPLIRSATELVRQLVTGG